MFDLDKYGLYVMKEYDDISIYSMHNAAVGVLSKTVQSIHQDGLQHMGLSIEDGLLVLEEENEVY